MSAFVEIRTEEIDGVTIAHLSGAALDASNVQRFRQEIAPVLERSTNLVLVLRDLAFVDSSGVGALLSCLRQMNARGGDVKLAELQQNVQRLFEMVRMDRLFDILETSDAAIAAFS